MNRLLAEWFGTFCLVLAGCGAIVVNDATGVIGHAGVALTFGLVVMAMVHTLGDVSGAHINPAVTVAFWLAGRFERARVPGYVAAQLLGAVAAAGLLRVLFADHPTLGATLPADGVVWRSFVLEVVLTWILMVAILGVATGPKERGLLAGLTIGGVVALEAMFAGPICGASMNPARSLGPAVVSGMLTHLWAYLLAPTLGAVLAIPTAAGLFGDRNTPPARPRPTLRSG